MSSHIRILRSRRAFQRTLEVARSKRFWRRHPEPFAKRLDGYYRRTARNFKASFRWNHEEN